MAYLVVLKPGDEVVFEFAYEGFLRCARPATREEHKQTTAILDKLESMSEPFEDHRVIPGFDPADKLAPEKRFMNPNGGWEIFEDKQYEYLKETLNKIQGIAAISRIMGKVYDWIDSAKHGDPKGLAKEAEEVRHIALVAKKE